MSSIPQYRQKLSPVVAPLPRTDRSLVGAPQYIWRAESTGAIASLVPADEPEPGFVEGQDLQRLPAVALADTLDGGGEVF